MPRNKDSPKRLKQQDLFGFLSQPPSTSKAGSAANTMRSSPAKRKRAAPFPVITVSDDESDDPDDPTSDVEVIHFEPRKAPTPGSDDDDQSPRRAKGRRAKVIDNPHKASPSGAVLFDLDSDVEVPAKEWRTRKGKDAVRRQRVSDSSSEAEQPPKRRKLTKGVRPPTPENSDEVDEADIVDTRLRARDKKSAFQKNLEKLKRKKLGRAPLESSEEESQDDSDGLDQTPFSGARPDGDGSDEPDDDEKAEDGFIVEDGDAVVPDLPTAFSMSTHQDFTHHFKIVCQLFVHLAVQPENERKSFMEQTLKENEYFSVPLQVARRKLSGVRDSLASSVWRSNYRKALEQFPTLTLTRLDFAVPQCDACHLGGRLSTLVGRLSGTPYDKLSFLPISRDLDTEDSEEEDQVVKVPREFNLGRFCAARTQLFHRLSHWEHSLYHALQGEVDQLQQPKGKRGFVRVAYAKGLQPPDDPSDADGIMDWLDERGLINLEWQKVRELMDSASKLESTVGKREDEVDLDIS